MKSSQFNRHIRQYAAFLFVGVVLAACGGNGPDAMLASARVYIAKNDLKAAVIQAKNALRENPDLAEARYLLGLALLRGDDPVGGETELRKALALKYPAELVVPPLVTSMLAQRHYKKVTDEFANIVLVEPTAKADLQTSLATAYIAQGNGILARTALAAALSADPAYAPALIVQARDKASNRDYVAALALVDSILAKTPVNHEALKLKADIQLYGTNQQGEALATYRKAIEAKPDFAAAHSAIVAILVQQEKIDEASKQLEQLKKIASNSPQTKYLETMIAFRKKDFKGAKELAQYMIKAAPDFVAGLQLAGAIELQLNSLLQAEAYLAKAVQAAPEAPLARRLLVSTYLRSGQPAKALATLQPALRAEILDGPTLALAGEVYLQNGDNVKAEGYFSKATKQDPANSRARTALALTHVVSGKDEVGLGELQDIATSDSGSTADLALISVHLRRKEFDKALKAIEGLEKKQPDKPLAANLRGRVLLAKQDVAGARKSFERSLAISPAYFPSLSSLAALDLLEKKPEDARKRFEAVLAKDPKNVQASLALAELSARSGRSKEEVAELITRAISANPTDKAPRLQLIELYLSSKDVKQALSAAESAVAAVPDSPELLDALGRAQQAGGDSNQAIATFGKVASMQPLIATPLLRLAEAYLMAKNKDAATQSLRKALDIKPDLLSAQRGLILLAIDAKNHKDAFAIARKVQLQRPKEAVGYLLEGDIAVDQKKWDVAADVYRRGIVQAPSPDLATRLHLVLGELGRPADQGKFAMEWLRDHPNDSAFRLYLGDRDMGRGDYAAAEKMYLAVLQARPKHHMAMNNLAWVMGKLNKEGALSYAEKAVALEPNQPAYFDTLAMLLSEKNNYAKAVEWEAKALALQPQNGLFKINLAKIHIKGGKKDLARKELDELAKLGNKFSDQAEVTSLLKSLSQEAPPK